MSLQKHVSLNIDVRGIGESPTLAINERVKLLRSQGQKIYDFGLGQSPFPVPAPVVEALRLHAHEKDYLPVKGLPALKEAVAGFHHQKDNVEASADCVLVGPGSKELMFLLQLVGRDSAIGCYLYILFIYATRGVAKWEKEVQSLDS